MKSRVYLAVFLCSLVFSASIHAQASRTVSTVERRIDTMNRQAKEYDLETMARERKGENAGSTAESSKRARQIRAEIEEDLKAIQTSYNIILIALQPEGEPGNHLVYASASEVKKHATRLKTNLSLPKPDDPDEKPLTLPPTPRKSLTELCRQIYEFITNPIFETQTGLNVEHAKKAGLSLDRVIDLSDKIGVRAETLKN